MWKNTKILLADVFLMGVFMHAARVGSFLCQGGEEPDPFLALSFDNPADRKWKHLFYDLIGMFPSFTIL